MAPFLISPNELEELPNPTAIKTRRLKSVVIPAIPRALEKKARRTNSPSINTSDHEAYNGKQEGLERPAGSSIEPWSTVTGQTDCKTLHFQGYDEEAEPAHEIVSTDNGSSKGQLLFT